MYLKTKVQLSKIKDTLNNKQIAKSDCKIFFYQRQTKNYYVNQAQNADEIIV